MYWRWCVEGARFFRSTGTGLNWIGRGSLHPCFGVISTTCPKCSCILHSGWLLNSPFSNVVPLFPMLLLIVAILNLQEVNNSNGDWTKWATWALAVINNKTSSWMSSFPSIIRRWMSLNTLWSFSFDLTSSRNVISCCVWSSKGSTAKFLATKAGSEGLLLIEWTATTYPRTGIF